MPMIFFFLYLFFLIIKLMNTIIVELKTYTFKTLVGKTVKCSTDSIVSVLISVVQYIVVYQCSFLNSDIHFIVSGNRYQKELTAMCMGLPYTVFFHSSKTSNDFRTKTLVQGVCCADVFLEREQRPEEDTGCLALAHSTVFP